MLTNTRNVADYVVEFLAVTHKVEAHVPAPYYDRAPKNEQGEYQNVTIGLKGPGSNFREIGV